MNNKEEVRTILKRIQKLRMEDGGRYARLLQSAVFSTMECLDLADAEALRLAGLAEDDPNALFRIRREVVECVRYWGSPTPKVPSYTLLDEATRPSLKLICFRSLEAVRELEKVARSPKPIEMEPQAFDDINDRVLLYGKHDDPVLPDAVRNFFNQFPEPADQIYWLSPAKPERRLDAWY